MTMKTASHLGRNPFEAKAAATAKSAKSATHILDTLDEITAAAKQPGWVGKAVQLPVRGIMFGLKSIMVVRYLFEHPEALKL